MEKFSMISIPIDANAFDLSAYYNVKMDSLNSFLEMRSVSIYCGLQMTTKFQIH